VRRLLLAGAALLLSACASEASRDASRFQSDWERNNEGRLVREASERTEVTPPPYPRAANLAQFAESGGFRFYVDRASISVGSDRIVRYALLARSPSGVDNVSYEGLNCEAGEYRTYALGHSDGTWLSRPGAWRSLSGSRVQPWRKELAKNYFCPLEAPIESAEEGVRALARGGNPRATTDLTGGVPSGPK
jgi:hypothetical protein